MPVSFNSNEDRKRIPRADRLNIVRDILYFISKSEKLSSSDIYKEISPKIVEDENNIIKIDTFSDYLKFLYEIDYIKEINNIIVITDLGNAFLKISEPRLNHLNSKEMLFLKQILISYYPYKEFINFTYSYDFNINKFLKEKKGCLSREDIITKYNEKKGLSGDRQARTFIYWSVQVGVLEYDKYSLSYIFILNKNISDSIFIKILTEYYEMIRDQNTKFAQIPELRSKVCCKLNISLSLFSQKILNIKEKNPTSLELAKASISREEVLEFGLTDGKYYYYYIRIQDTILMSDKPKFNLIDPIKERMLTSNPHEKYSLTRNPFRKSQIANPNTSIFWSRCREEELEPIKEFIIDIYSSKEWSGLILAGEYGSGKSHTLFFIRDEINKQLTNFEKDRAIAYYIESPKNTITELYIELIDQIGREVILDYFSKIITEDILNILQSNYGGTLYEHMDMPNLDINSLSEIGKRINKNRLHQVWENASKKLIETGCILHKDYAKTIIVLLTSGDTKNKKIAWDYICGKKINKREARELELLTEMITEDEVIKYVFPSLINVLKHNNISMIYLLIDELESIASKNLPTSKYFLENLRSLIDNNLKGMCIIFSCVTEAWDILKQNSPGLAERIRYFVNLRPLNASQTKLLIEDYLERSRTDNYIGLPYSPFTIDAIMEINKKSDGSVRYILQHCYEILYAASNDLNIIDEISPNYVTTILGE